MNSQKGTHENFELQYPVTQEQLDKMDNIGPCRLTNPMIGNSYGTKIPDSHDEQSAAFEVARVRLDVKNGKFPFWFMDKYNPFKRVFGEFPREIPQALKYAGLSFSDPSSLAKIVHMDFPSEMPRFVHRWLLRSGVNVKSHNQQYTRFCGYLKDCKTCPLQQQCMQNHR